ncbi:hypothetical protein CK203_092134 [Vitis vinifera]|uniref:Uncharacterized protein n=1 Tax=Vitis vinifera TaxID=29760 RepID=A0A438ECP3_VITVI|nr:hypothetical protein CK203_092134 [Vitis vinifera]
MDSDADKQAAVFKPYEKILCRVCFDEQINMVLLPCRHHVLCRFSLVLIVTFFPCMAALVVRSARGAPFAVFLSKRDCLYTMCSINCQPINKTLHFINLGLRMQKKQA